MCSFAVRLHVVKHRSNRKEPLKARIIVETEFRMKEEESMMNFKLSESAE